MLLTNISYHQLVIAGGIFTTSYHPWMIVEIAIKFIFGDIQLSSRDDSCVHKLKGFTPEVHEIPKDIPWDHNCVAIN